MNKCRRQTSAPSTTVIKKKGADLRLVSLISLQAGSNVKVNHCGASLDCCFVARMCQRLEVLHNERDRETREFSLPLVSTGSVPSELSTGTFSRLPVCFWFVWREEPLCACEHCVLPAVPAFLLTLCCEKTEAAARAPGRPH